MKPVVLVFCIFLIGSLAAQANQAQAQVNPLASTCASRCSGISTKFRYQKSTSYVYKYESETKVQIAGTSQNVASVNLDATATFSVQDTCEWVLKLSEVKIRGPSSAQLGADWAQGLETTATRFSYDDGEIKEICPSADEPIWAVNIKRGVLSTFQLAHDPDSQLGETETDVTGRCPTVYEVQQEQGAKTVYKTKDLMACYDHASNYSSMRMVNYEVRSQFQNLPVTDCKQRCRFTVQRDIVNDVGCTETHNFLPFRNAPKGGVVATVTTKLHFNQENRNLIQANVGPRASLLFDDSEMLFTESKDALAQAKSTLKNLCDKSGDDVRPETPEEFAELVYELKKMSLADLRTLAPTDGAKLDCPKARKFIVDALPMCATTACVSLVSDILGGKVKVNLTPYEEKGYFASLALTPEPTKDMIKAVTPIISTIPSHGLYGLTTLVNAYCRLHPDCDTDAEVKQFFQTYLTLLKPVNPAQPVAQSVPVIDALRALGNIGEVKDGIAEKLKYVTEKRNHMDVRLAGLQSLRRTPLTEQTDTALFQLFADEKEDVEIRISAFLVLMNLGPSDGRILSILNELGKETQLNQIESFVGSYFRQVRESKDPSKENIQEALKKIPMPKKSYDPRKYSRYYELSHFNYDYNVGAHADSSIIFTPDSYLPKQASLNLSIDLFGSEINLFEIGMRTENLDDVIDNLFGPEGYFTNPAGFYFKEDSKSNVKNPKIKELQDSFDRTNKKTSSGLDLSMYMRVFGDEMIYRSHYGVSLVDNFQKAINPKALLDAMAKQQDVKLALHKMPLDMVFTVSALSGLPLRFDINGTIALNLDVSAKADLTALPRGNVDVKLMLKPSAAVELAAQLTIHTGKVKSGVRLTKSMHTSTAATLNIQAQNKESLSVKLELPKDKFEIANVQTQIFTIVNDVPTEEKGVPTRGGGTVCSLTRMSKLFGLKVCTHTSFPNATTFPDAPRFPLTGPSDMNVYIEKTDPGLKSYELSATWKNSQAGRNVKVSLNTPGSQVDREIVFDYNYERGKSLNMELKSPFKKVKATGTLESSSADRTKGKITLNVDQSKEYTIFGTMDKTVLPETGVRYVFDAQVTAPNLAAPGTLKATVERTPGKRASVDLSILKVFETPVEWKAAVEKSAAQIAKYSYTSNWKCPKMNRNTKALLNYQSLMTMDYSIDFDYQRVGVDQSPHKITYKHKHAVLRADKGFRLTANSDFTSSWYPDFNDGYDVTIEKSQEKLEIRAAFLDNGKQGLAYTQVSQLKPNDVTTTATLLYPNLNVNEKVEIIYKNLHPKEFVASVKLEDVTAKKEAKVMIQYKNKRQDMIDFEGDALLKTPNFEFKAHDIIKETTKNEYTATTTFEWTPSKKAEVKSTFKSTGASDWELKSNIMLPNSQPMEFFKKFKSDRGSTKYISYLKQQSKTLYDFNLDSVKESDSKRNINARFKSTDFINADIGLNGFYETLPIGKRVSGTIQKNGQNYMKTDIVLPNDWSLTSEKQIKVGHIWGLPNEAKEVLYDHKMTKSPTGNVFETTLKMDLPDANYKLDVRRHHNDQGGSRTLNATLSQKNSPLISVGISGARPLSRPGQQVVDQTYTGDVSLITYQPMDPRHLTGDFKVTVASEKATGSLMLNSVKDSQKLGFEFMLGKNNALKRNRNGIEKEFGLTVNNQRFKLRNFYSRSQPQAAQELGLEGYAELKTDKEEKKFTWNVECVDSKLNAEFTTPFPKAPKITAKVELTTEGKRQKRMFEMTWGTQKITAMGKKEAAENFYDADLSVETTMAALKNYKHSLKYDVRNGRQAEFQIEWNSNGKIGANYKRATEQSGDETWAVGAKAKVGTALDWETSADAKWNPSTGKYVTNNLVRTNPTTQYKANVDLNTKTMAAKVDLENVPGVTSPVKAEVKKISEGEYELKLTDNSGANQGLIGFKLTPENQKMKVETKAFKGNYESEWGQNKFSVAGDIVPDPSAPTKSYGVKVSSETATPKDRDTLFVFAYPERKVSFRSKRTIDWPNKYNHLLELNSNIGKQQPLSFELNVAPDTFEIHLKDTKLPQGFHIVAKKVKTGDRSAPLYASNGEISIQYSRDPKNHVVLKKETKVENIGGRNKYTNSLEISQEANRLKHKVWSSFLLNSCASPTCEYVLVIGTQYMTPQNDMVEYSFDAKGTNYDGTSIITVAKDKYNVRAESRGGQLKYNIAKNNQELYDVLFERVKGEKKISFSVVKKPTNALVFHASASLPSNDLATFKMFHDESGTTVKDLEWTIKLEESDHLRMRFYRRPGLTEAFKAMAGKITSAQQQVGAPTFILPHKAIIDDMRKELRPMFDEWTQEEADIAKELKIEGGQFAQTIRNELRELNNEMQPVFVSIAQLVSELSNAFQARIDDVISISKNIAKQMPDIASKVGPTFRDIKTRVQERLKKIVGNLQLLLAQVSKDLRLDEVVNFIRKSWNSAPGAGFAERLRTLYKNIMDLFPNVKTDSMLADLRQKVRQIYEDRSRQWQQAWQKFKEDASKTEDGREFVALIEAIFAKLTWAYSYNAPAGTDLAQGKVGVSAVRDWFRTVALNNTKRGFSIERPKEGEMIVDWPLMRNYKSLPDLGRSFTPDNIKAMVHDIESSVNDMMGMYSDNSGDDSLFSRRQTYGMIFGDQYFKTFDGKVFTFAGDKCSYLLARDFEHGKFSVFVDFEEKQGRSVRKSVTVEYGENKIEMLADGKVNINGKSGELPWHVVNEDQGYLTVIKVYKGSKDVTILETYDGLKVKCDADNHMCGVKLAGRFHGKTKGLLGRNDGEDADDMLMPDGSKAQDVAAFAGAWALDQRCARSPSRSTTNILPETHAAIAECNKLFSESSSPFRSCFGSVQAVDFLSICKQSATQFVQNERDESKHLQGVCDVSAAYLKACQQTIDMPSQCISCDLQEPMKLYETKTTKTDVVDVIFVVEERQCMTWVKNKLVSMAQKMESGMKNVRYGLVGFNGAGVHYLPHFHTGQSLVNMDIKGLQMAVPQLEYAEFDPKVLKNPMDAIEFVTDKFPFRGGSRKLIALLACNNCEGFDFDYYMLQQKLLGQDIGLMLLTTQKVELTSGVRNDIIAFDGRAMITTDKREDVNIRKDLVEPHDSCTVLAQETNGTVFSYNERSSSAIIDLMAEKLAKLAQPPRCTVCECQSEHFHAKTACFPCEIPRPASLAQDNTGFFNNPYKKLQKWQSKAAGVGVGGN